MVGETAARRITQQADHDTGKSFSRRSRRSKMEERKFPWRAIILMVLLGALVALGVDQLVYESNWLILPSYILFPLVMTLFALVYDGRKRHNELVKHLAASGKIVVRPRPTRPATPLDVQQHTERV
jgi:uncharacterized membrane protein